MKPSSEDHRFLRTRRLTQPTTMTDPRVKAVVFESQSEFSDWARWLLNCVAVSTGRQSGATTGRVSDSVAKRSTIFCGVLIKRASIAPKERLVMTAVQRTLLLGSLCLVLATPAGAQNPSRRVPAQAASKGPSYDKSVPEPTLANVAYGPHERHVLDFWKANADTPTPVAFVIHGGGWQNGEKERMHRFADVNALLAEGISVVAINYRLIRHAHEDQVTPPVKAPLHDAARALQFIRSKSADWNIDKARIGAAGGSAGACSSLWLAYHDDLADPASDDPIARESSRLWCAAVIGAQTTLDPKQMKEWTPNSRYGGHAFGLKAFPEFLAQRETILPWITEYSPYALVTRDDPPVYLIYGTPPAIGETQPDPTHTANFGVKLQEHCIETGIACELVYPGAPNVKYDNPTSYLIATLKAPAN